MKEPRQSGLNPEAAQALSSLLTLVLNAEEIKRPARGKMFPSLFLLLPAEEAKALARTVLTMWAGSPSGEGKAA